MHTVTHDNQLIPQLQSDAQKTREMVCTESRTSRKERQGRERSRSSRGRGSGGRMRVKGIGKVGRGGEMETRCGASELDRAERYVGVTGR